jgi:hypothetical protein
MEALPPRGDPFDEIAWCCKAPWALLACGRRALALSVLHRCRIACEAVGERWPARASGTASPAYAAGWLTTAAWIAGTCDLARFFYRLLERHICPHEGGVLSAPGDVYFDAALQGAGLHAAVAVGDTTTARKIGGLTVRLIREQPDPVLGFYMLYAPRRGHLRDVSDSNRAERLLVRVEPRQPYANLGFALQGLCRLHEATGEHTYLEAAADALDTLLGGGHRDDLVSHGQNHKVGHAAILLYRHLKRRRHLDAAVAIADCVAKRIGADGRAWADVFYDRIEDQPPLFSVRTTCDSALWLRQMADEVNVLSSASMEHP